MVVTFTGGHEVPVPDTAKHLVSDVSDPRKRTVAELRVRDQLATLVDDLAARLGLREPN